MSCTRKVDAWKPVGEVEVRKRCLTDGSTQTRSLGQVEEVNLAYEVEQQTIADSITGQGDAAVDTTITSIGLGMVVRAAGDLENLAMLMLGEVTSVAAGAAVTETHKLYKGSRVWLERFATSITSITKAGEGGSSLAASDYTHDATGPMIHADAAITDGDEYVIVYAAPAENVIQAGTVPAAEYEVRFRGRNRAMKKADGTPKEFLVVIRRAVAAAPDNLPLTSTEFAGPNTTWKILSDQDAPAGVSPFYSYREIAEA